PSEAKVQFDVYLYDLPARSAASVASKMLTPDRFFWKSLSLNRPDTLRLADLNRELKAQTKNRVPVLDEQARPKYIIHRSAITEYLAEHGASEELTLKNLLDQPDQHELFENSFATVAPGATLADAAAAMKGISSCRDVFVTKDGTREAPV